MKKSLTLIILFLFTGIYYSLGQGYYVISHVLDSNKRHYYVGSLAPNSGNVIQKLKLDVFGGNFTDISAGIDTYTITTRYAKVINIEKAGGATNSYELKVYKNGEKFDFVIQINSNYVSLHVQPWLINGSLDQITEAIPVNVVRYDPEGKTEVTESFSKKIMKVTDINGNVGIGTLQPKAKLDVRGKIIADEVEIKVNKGADFVFEPDYSLPTLSKVEDYIKKNKHLLDIPSEKEMIEKGITVNEMQIKLLQKIEELTLYVIELDKKDKEKSILIEELQNQLKQYK